MEEVIKILFTIVLGGLIVLGAILYLGLIVIHIRNLTKSDDNETIVTVSDNIKVTSEPIELKEGDCICDWVHKAPNRSGYCHIHKTHWA